MSVGQLARGGVDVLHVFNEAVDVDVVVSQAMHLGELHLWLKDRRFEANLEEPPSTRPIRAT
jgi:hypothetical protein